MINFKEAHRVNKPNFIYTIIFNSIHVHFYLFQIKRLRQFFLPQPQSFSFLVHRVQGCYLISQTLF